MKFPRAEAVFGLADGMTSALGLVLGLVITGHAGAAWAAGLSAGLAAFPGMASGKYQSGPEDGYFAAVICGLATTAGSILVVLPYLLTAGTAALTASLAVVTVLCALVAWLRPDSGLKAVALSYGITIAAAGLVVGGAFIPS